MKALHYHQMKRLPRGSLTVFYRRIYKRLHAPEESPSKHISSKQTPVELQQNPSSINAPFQYTNSDGASTKDAVTDMFHTKSVNLPDDSNWLCGKECYLRKNLEIFCLTDSDLKSFANRPEMKRPSKGQVGVRCIHCSQQICCKGLSDPDAFRLLPSVKNIRLSILSLQGHLGRCQHAPSYCNQVFKSPLSAHTVRIVSDYYHRTSFDLGLVDDRMKVLTLPQQLRNYLAKSNKADWTPDSSKSSHEVGSCDDDVDGKESTQLLPTVTPFQCGNKRHFASI